MKPSSKKLSAAECKKWRADIGSYNVAGEPFKDAINGYATNDILSIKFTKFAKNYDEVPGKVKTGIKKILSSSNILSKIGRKRARVAGINCDVLFIDDSSISKLRDEIEKFLVQLQKEIKADISHSYKRPWKVIGRFFG